MGRHTEQASSYIPHKNRPISPRLPSTHMTLTPTATRVTYCPDSVVVHLNNKSASVFASASAAPAGPAGPRKDLAVPHSLVLLLEVSCS